jgi:CIC family chloride channel protein
LSAEPVPRRAPLRAEIPVATLVGAITGLGVALMHELVFHTWIPLSRTGGWWPVVTAPAGLVAAYLLIRVGRQGSNETTEEYIRVFQTPGGSVERGSVAWRLAASLATICGGGALGLEGPSIFLGAFLGDRAGWRLGDRTDLHGADRTILIAGAAAGIAAIFKAPLTGLIFALEVPYKDDVARRALIPAIFGAAAGYLASVAILGTAPLFQISGITLGFRDLLASLLVGLVCGLFARAFTFAIDTSRKLHAALGAGRSLVLGSALLAGVGAISIRLFGDPLALGPGYNAIGAVTRPGMDLWLILALIALRLIATPSTAGGGGAGGLFFPTVAIGAAIGGLVGLSIPGPNSLYVVVGIAALLGSAYKVPLAGVAFVAETTGAPGYVIPGLLAAAIAYLLSGEGSLSDRQTRSGRNG